MQPLTKEALSTSSAVVTAFDALCKFACLVTAKEACLLSDPSRNNSRTKISGYKGTIMRNKNAMKLKPKIITEANLISWVLFV